MENRIFIPDFMIILLEIHKGNNCPSDIKNATNMTYNYIHSLKKEMVKRGWIYITLDGRRHIMNTTEKGKEVIAATSKLLEALGIGTKDINKYRRRKKESNKKAKLKEEIKEQTNNLSSEKKVELDKIKELETSTPEELEEIEKEIDEQADSDNDELTMKSENLEEDEWSDDDEWEQDEDYY